MSHSAQAAGVVVHDFARSFKERINAVQRGLFHTVAVSQPLRGDARGDLRVQHSRGPAIRIGRLPGLGVVRPAKTDPASARGRGARLHPQQIDESLRLIVRPIEQRHIAARCTKSARVRLLPGQRRKAKQLFELIRHDHERGRILCGRGTPARRAAAQGLRMGAALRVRIFRLRRRGCRCETIEDIRETARTPAQEDFHLRVGRGEHLPEFARQRSEGIQPRLEDDRAGRSGRDREQQPVFDVAQQTSHHQRGFSRAARAQHGEEARRLQLREQLDAMLPAPAKEPPLAARKGPQTRIGRGLRVHHEKNARSAASSSSRMKSTLPFGRK